MDRLSASVQFSGEWNGAVLIECSYQMACQLAGRYLSTEPSEELDDLVKDVFGELANMIGGNLKSAVARGIHTSTPAVVETINDNLLKPGTTTEQRMEFQCSEGRFWITVLKHNL